jgi:LysR family transcriptional regulator, cys regulon transcriptional activator
VNLQRLEVFEAIIRNDFNVSRASEQLRQSQPGLSKQLQILEQELGFPVFTRRGRRLVGLTAPGREVHRVAERMLRDRDALSGIAAGFKEANRGSLTIATTHTQARYALPQVIVKFRQLYPQVHLALHQGSPTQVIEDVLSGNADIAIATEGLKDESELVALPCYDWNRAIIAPPEHPISQVSRLTLEEVARHPIVTYAFAFTGRSQINAAFAARGLRPEVVLSAIDADIIKTYVKLGFGVGIVAKMAMAENDQGLVSRDASHLFPASTTVIGIPRGAYLKGYVYSFIELFAPHLKAEVVDDALLGTHD